MRVTITLLCALVLNFFAVTPAIAQPDQGPYSSAGGHYGPIYGWEYTNYSEIWLNNNKPKGSSYLHKDNNNGDISYVAAQVSTYKNGALCKSNDLKYGTMINAQNWFYSAMIQNGCGPGNYNSKGSTGAYNGNGYNYYYTFTSPTITKN